MDLAKLRELNIKLTKNKLKESITADFLVIQAIHTIDELIKIINRLVENLRERYSYYSITASKKEELKEFLAAIKEKQIDKDISVFNKEDFDAIFSLISAVESLIKAKERNEEWLEKLMNNYHNLKNTAGTFIGARLIAIAGSMKRLAELPSSTIQVLGAEKALFRHLRTGAKPPRFGVIFSHEAITKAEKKGKAARQLASKISIAAKKDYFKK
ncbi:MAG: hypothetical protein AB1571_04345 [Nanoarchaeota archaeon]